MTQYNEFDGHSPSMEELYDKMQEYMPNLNDGMTRHYEPWVYYVLTESYNMFFTSYMEKMEKNRGNREIMEFNLEEFSFMFAKAVFLMGVVMGKNYEIPIIVHSENDICDDVESMLYKHNPEGIDYTFS